MDRARPGTLSTSTPSSAIPTTTSRDLCTINDKSVSKTGPSLKEVKQVLLNIQLDAIAALVDEQATRRLWKLFTNCAGSIAHGRRLENLSWRTWGRDQSVLRQRQQDQRSHEFHNDNNVHNEPILPSPQLAVTPMSTSTSETDAIESPTKPASNCTASVNPGSSITTRRRQSTSCTTSTSSPRPSYRRFDSNESTPAFASTSGSGSIAVSRSPPLGQLIKRVIFTPPDHSDDHRLALYVATPDRPSEPSQLDSEDFGRTDAHHSLHQEVDNEGDQQTRQESTPTAAVTTPHIKLQSHVSSTTSESLTSKSQAEGLSTTCLPSRTGNELQPLPQRTASSIFPTVVISQSTPKPTPPDTPARCLSPTTFQALTPLHALSLTHALSPQTVPSSTQQSTSSPSPNSLNGSHHNCNQTPPTTSSSTISSYPVMSEIVTASRMPVEELNNDVHSNNSPSQVLANPLLPNDTDITAAAPVADPVNGGGVTKQAYDSSLPVFSNASRHSTSVGPSTAVAAVNRVPISTQASQGPSHPRMFFLQRDSNSFSPESNSRSNSHSRSPASPTQSHHRRHGSSSRFSDTRSPSQSRSPDPRNRASVNPVTYQHNESQTGVKTTQGMHESGKNGTRLPSASEGHSSSESRVRERVDQAVQINEQSARQPSSSPHAPSAFSNRSQRLMARNRRSHRAYLGRALDRPSSRSRNGFKSSPGSVGSRNSGLAGSLDNNVGSASVSGMGSVSTSSSSRLVMGRLNRVHAPLDKETSRSTAQAAQQSPTSPLSRQTPSQPPPQVSPLATLPEPLRMEVLERQVVQSNMNRQSGGVQRRKIKLESDSEEDDDSFDEDEEEEDEEASEEENVQQQQRRGSSQEKEEQVVEDEDGSSWDDEDDVVVLPAKRTQTTAPPAPPPAQRESHEQGQTGSDSSGRHRVHFPVQKAAGHLQHVKSKTKLAQQQQHHHRAVSPPPPARQQPARKAAAPHGTAAQTHARASQSSEGLLAQAAREAQRQQDLFKPLPRESYSSNNLVREKSLTSLSRGGKPSNLTLLLNPDPYWFPQGHPYRESPRDPMDPKLSRSMEEIYGRSSSGTGMRSPARPGVGLGFGGLKMTSTNASPAPATRRDSAPPPTVARTQAIPSVAPSPVPEPKPRHSPNKTSKSPPAPSKLRASKSSMAIPVVLGVTASSAPRDEKKADMMEMSLRQMGARQQRQPRHPGEPTRPSIAQLSTHSSDKSKTSQESQQSSRGNRLGARPPDVELSDSEDEEQSPKSNEKGVSGRSLAQEHLAAVMDGKDPALVKAGLSASRSILASPDAPPVDPSRQVDSASYRPPAPPSSPSVYNPYEAKRAQGHLPHTPTPPSTTRPPTGRSNRPRPHSSHGQLLTAADPAPGPALPTPTRERRQPATSQPLVPVSIEPTPAAAPVPWPYNLPYPPPLQSPRTTRLKMLAAEVPDDLRKDLLWERKANRIAPILGNNGPVPIRRGANLKPLTTLRPEGSQPRDEPDETEEAMRERLQREREAKERYDKMRTRTWNGVIYQRPVW